jgi:hypothetical protein
MRSHGGGHAPGGPSMMAFGGMSVAGGLVGGLAGAAIYENQDAIGQRGPKIWSPVEFRPSFSTSAPSTCR